MMKQRVGRVIARAIAAILRVREERAQHPPWRAREQQRRHGEAEQEVLHHVRAEQIGVAQIVKRPVQRCRR